MSRVVAGEHLLDDQAKEVLRIMIRKGSVQDLDFP